MSLGLGLKFYDKNIFIKHMPGFRLAQRGTKGRTEKWRGRRFYDKYKRFINCPLLFSRLLTENVFGIKSYYNPEMKNE